MAPCKAVFIIEWITMDKKVKMNEMKMKYTRYVNLITSNIEKTKNKSHEVSRN